ncbi:hypothetical protein LOK49_LG03G00864 [Camellia lanceoleosa]|uniref:Uncharacterized protein n=1 Tax=Camellia lanceoleosa TaxID=1840588 RepID=A0ACC0IE81_9ERIC|nr:hypothetical protein LOK49_LG03G00864 [Camellia lanceoleosa]
MAWWNFISFCSFPNFRGFFQGSMSEIELGTYTIKSHGATVARNHMHDWLILLLLVVIEDVMTDLKYPMMDNSVPAWAVPLYAVLLPIVVFLPFYRRRRNVYDLHHSILGLLFAVLITGVLTDAIKNAIGRPHFFWRCFPDGIDNYDQWGNVICHGIDSIIKDGHKSFPSGHTSWSFAGLGFLSLYLSGKIKVFDQRQHVEKLCIIFLPLLIASLVGISRVDGTIGRMCFVVATFCYLQFFPPRYHTDGWVTHAYFHALEESGANSQLGHPMNGSNRQVAEAQLVNQTNGATQQCI